MSDCSDFCFDSAVRYHAHLAFGCWVLPLRSCHFRSNYSHWILVSQAAVPTVKSGLQRRVIMEPFKDSGAPLTNLFLIPLSQSWWKVCLFTFPVSGWVGPKWQIHYNVAISLPLLNQAGQAFLIHSPWATFSCMFQPTKQTVRALLTPQVAALNVESLLSEPISMYLAQSNFMVRPPLFHILCIHSY